MNFSGVSAAAVLVFFAAAAGKSAKRRRWRMQRGDFEEVPRLAGTTVPGNRLARRCYPGGSVGFFGTGKGSGVSAAAVLVFFAAAAGKSAKRRRWRKKRGDFEEVPRLAGTTVPGNRLARRCYPGGSVGFFRDRERVRRFCRSSSSCIFCRSRREIGEAPPVADAARRFRGSAPIGRHDSAGESAGTTVLPRRLSRIFRDRERVRRFCRSSSYTSCRCRRGRGHCGRSSGPGGAAFSRCRHRRRSRRWPWPPAHA